jgi:hypothetical protein
VVCDAVCDVIKTSGTPLFIIYFPLFKYFITKSQKIIRKNRGESGELETVVI